MSRGRVYDSAELPGFVAVDADDRIGLITYRIEGDDCEIRTLDSRRRRLKPQIPQTGCHGISIRDEIELEMRILPPDP